MIECIRGRWELERNMQRSAWWCPMMTKHMHTTCIHVQTCKMIVDHSEHRLNMPKHECTSIDRPRTHAMGPRWMYSRPGRVGGHACDMVHAQTCEKIVDHSKQRIKHEWTSIKRPLTHGMGPRWMCLSTWEGQVWCMMGVMHGDDRGGERRWVNIEKFEKIPKISKIILPSSAATVQAQGPLECA